MLPGARVQRLSRLGDALRNARRVLAPEPFQIPCPAGHTLHGWILRAPRAPRRGPLVLMIHGGPYAMYGWSFMHEFQVLAQHGYHVAYVNLRGSTGYGRAFMRALVGTWGSRDFEDVMRVADVLERLPFVDKRRLAIAGGSYGGYLTAWTIAHTRRFAAAMAMRGVYDLPSMFGTSDSGPELLTEFEGQAPWESIDRWWRVSPVAHAAAIRTPLLLVHAENDHRCPVSQAEEMFTALRVLERDVELVRFGGEGHGLSRSGRPQNRVERLHILLEWLGRKL
jgi:dipeptidyl aminopeptidase/acylaminoacyl peptidase